MYAHTGADVDIFPVEDLKTFQKCRQLSLRTRGDDQGTRRGYVGRIPGTGTYPRQSAWRCAGKVDKKDYRVYAALGDGEIQEGQIWEAAMAAGNYGLDNLTVFVDNNNLAD